MRYAAITLLGVIAAGSFVVRATTKPREATPAPIVHAAPPGPSAAPSPSADPQKKASGSDNPIEDLAATFGFPTDPRDPAVTPAEMKARVAAACERRKGPANAQSPLRSISELPAPPALRGPFWDTTRDPRR
jgi:hypothetical protein